MLNTYLKLVALAVVVLVALAILHFVLPLLITAAVIAALVLGVLFVVNFFRRVRPLARPAPRALERDRSGSSPGAAREETPAAPLAPPIPERSDPPPRLR